MTTGILITARLGSTRLKRKHLLEVNGQPIVQVLINRIAWEFQSEIRDRQLKIVIATSNESENRSFESLTPSGVTVFYGSIDNIPLRHLEAANACGFTQLISVDGDDILCSPTGMRKIYEGLLAGNQYLKTSGLPFGMNAMGYSRLFLENALAQHEDDLLETGWGRVFDVGRLLQIAMPALGPEELLRFSLDYPEDFLFFKAVVEAFEKRITTATDQEIVDYVMDNRIYTINEPISRGYWDNFYKTMEKEARHNESE